MISKKSVENRLQNSKELLQCLDWMLNGCQFQIKEHDESKRKMLEERIVSEEEERDALEKWLDDIKKEDTEKAYKKQVAAMTPSQVERWIGRVI